MSHDHRKPCFVITGAPGSAGRPIVGGLEAHRVASPGFPPGSDIPAAFDATLSRAICDLHRTALAAMDRTWWDWRPVEPSTLLSQSRQDLIRDGVAAFRTSGLTSNPVFVADSKICLLWELWSSILDELGMAPVFIIPFGNGYLNDGPVSRKRQSGDAHNILIWLRYMIEAEKCSRGHRRLFVGTDLESVGVPGNLSELVLRLHADTPEIMRSDTPPAPSDSIRIEPGGGASERFLAPFVTKAREGLERLAEEPHDPESIAILQAVNDSLNSYIPFLHDIATGGLPIPIAAEMRIQKAEDDVETLARLFQDWSAHPAKPLLKHLHFGLLRWLSTVRLIPANRRETFEHSAKKRDPSRIVLHQKRAGEGLRREVGSIVARQVDSAADDGEKSGQYREIADKPISPATGAPRAIAFYLPQFHPIPQNDEWWGRGFTEWTNVVRAKSRYPGHYQPRLPGELGFYDLRLPEVMARQIELAKLYGLHGFCFHYYWFNGQRLLERPVEEFRKKERDPRFGFDYCLCWANENWSRRWSGSARELLMQQRHSTQDHRNVFRDLSRFLSDHRYITMGGKPVILIYRPALIPDVRQLTEIWREEADKLGLPGLQLLATNAFGTPDIAADGFDGVCQFPPHGVARQDITQTMNFFDTSFKGNVFSYPLMVESEIANLAELQSDDETLLLPGVMPSWDNEARRANNGQVFDGATPEIFGRWLAAACNYLKKFPDPENRLLFINAWNEWAEGTYMEPDRLFGYANLAELGKVLQNFDQAKDGS